MRALFALSLSLSLALVAGCASKTRTVDVADPSETPTYRTIELDGRLSVDVVVGPRAKIELTGHESDLEDVEVRVDGDVLALDANNHHLGDGQVHARITTPALSEVRVRGGSRLSIEGLSRGSLGLQLSGAAKVEAQGTLDKLDISISGVASVDARRVVARHVSAQISGNGSAVVHASDRLDASVSGVGRIRYAGQPEQVARSVSGVGSVRPL